MNARRLNLVLTGVSLGLVGVIAYLVWMLRAPIRTMPEVVTTTNVVTNMQIAVRKINATNFLSSLLKRPFHWSMLEATNYQTFIQHLHDFGCPEETIQDIIIADIAKQYARRRAELRASLPAPPYWQAPDKFEYDSAAALEINDQLAALDQEQRALVRTLLGVDYDAEIAKFTGEPAPTDVRLDFLSADKQPEVASILAKYADLENEYFGGPEGVSQPVDEADLRHLEAQRDAELAKLLTPDEFFEFQVRNSTTAHALQTKLEALDPSEQEFRQIFKLQKTMQDTLAQQFDPDPLKNQEIRDQVVKDAQAAFNDELKKELGPDRYTAYVRSQDQDYQALVQIADRYALPKAKADKVYEMKMVAERQREQVATNPDLTEQQRTAALAAIARESQRSVVAELGSDLYEAYRESGGSWILQMPASETISPLPTQTLPPMPDGFVMPSR